jgi:3-dehydrosphinganine reductase
MVQEGHQGKIVFVSSILGYMGFVGYSSYTPGKHALRGKCTINAVGMDANRAAPGLAETLRNELLLYDIDVHIFFPATIYSPGYEQENLTKPKITLKIEEGDEGTQPEACAQHLLDGLSLLWFLRIKTDV